MWRFVAWLLSLFALTSGHLSASEISCPPWDNIPQHQITPTRIPEALEHVFLRHKGHGLLAKFEEEKTVLLLQKPLRSSGHLIFLPHKGLYRKLATPFQQELLITRTVVQQRDHHGKVETLALASLPPAQVMVEGLLTVFSGSWETIHAQFQVYFSPDTHQWTLGLTPKHTVLSKMISCMILEGKKDHVLRLSVRETNGDTTRTQFLESQILPPEQWGHYQSYFDFGH
jgi:hypothetical protein